MDKVFLEDFRVAFQVLKTLYFQTLGCLTLKNSI